MRAFTDSRWPVCWKFVALFYVFLQAFFGEQLPQFSSSYGIWWQERLVFQDIIGFMWTLLHIYVVFKLKDIYYVVGYHQQIFHEPVIWTFSFAKWKHKMFFIVTDQGASDLISHILAIKFLMRCQQSNSCNMFVRKCWMMPFKTVSMEVDLSETNISILRPSSMSSFKHLLAAIGSSAADPFPSSG